MPDLIHKVPPHSLEAEQSLLGSILMDREAITKIADIVTADDFYKDSHRLIFEAINGLYAKHEPLDILSVGNRLIELNKLEAVGGQTYLLTIVNSVPTAANVSHYAQIVAKKAALRRLLKAGVEISRLGFDEEAEIEQILDQAERTVLNIAKFSSKQNFLPIRSVLDEAFDRIDELHREKGKLRGLPTGFPDLDNLLGGLQKSNLIVLAARPSVGKTSLALDMARHIAVKARVPVGIFSLEMSKEELVDRFLCAEAGVNLWKMRTGKLSDRPEDDDFPKIGQAMGLLSDAPIFIDDSPNNTVIQMRTKARRLQVDHQIGLIIVDYLQLMESRTNVENRVQEIAEITRSLKALARELGVPVLALSQLSRAVELIRPAIPKLAHLRESGCLAGDTLITRADTGEQVPIKNLVGCKNIPIASLNAAWQTESKYISKVFSSGHKQIFELKMRSGRAIKASANHPFLTIDGWKRLDNLQSGERLAAPRTLNLNIQSGAITDDELILLAHLTGDGCVLSNQPIHYTSADKNNIAIVAATANKLFKIKPRVVKQKNWFHVYLPSPYHLTHRRHNPIIEWFNKLGLKPVRSYEKVLPPALFKSGQNSIALFLHHLWATDGNISWKYLNGRKPAGAIYYSTTSKTLAEQVRHLLLRLNILGVMRAVKQIKGAQAYRTNYQVHIQGKEEQLKFLRMAGSYGSRGQIIPRLVSELKQIKPNPNFDVVPNLIWQTTINQERIKAGLSWREVSSRIETAYCGSSLFKAGLSRERLSRVAEALQSPPLFAIAKSDIFWDEVASITPLGTEEVFDATVPETHNFVANDLFVHNSIEQDSDVVMFIYRKAADRNYRLEDISPEERHLAEIYIAKHRNGPTGLAKLFFEEELASFKNLASKNF